ncbi:hypothetical protein C7974DRAFT_380923 [Boeremia exigua]|uniref:uncharacterized protein n=1 Tax=Boeremia exigua TaxID=749465 RepID=UPI001E8DD13D|nr:uncharacterized protein C7974DRAFT_380923 [Boeremia exigua]KAH6613216.1 hypothetical protein C7974DRAFT_380923 [Boeremia exigua]
MFDPFWYLDKRTDVGNTNTNLDDVDDSNGYGDDSTTSSNEGIATPTTTSTATLYATNTNCSVSNVVLQQHPGLTPLPEPSVLLVEIQKSVEDVAQVVGRFGPKMATILCSPHIMTALFPDHKKLHLSSLEYTDDFACRLEQAFGDPISLTGNSHGFTLDFESVCKTDMTLPYTISIQIGPDRTTNGEKKIELTAAYGGAFKERRIFVAPIGTFRFQKRNFGETTVPLVIDESST